jgi:hypothetical protein
MVRGLLSLLRIEEHPDGYTEIATHYWLAISGSDDMDLSLVPVSAPCISPFG